MQINKYIKNNVFLNVDYNDIKIDVSKIIDENTASIEKKKKILFQKSILYPLISCAILIVVAALVFLVRSGYWKSNEKYSQEVLAINESIDDLDNIEDRKEKMIRIVALERQVINLPEAFRSRVNLEKLSYESIVNANALKSESGLAQYSVGEKNYYVVDELLDTTKIKQIECFSLANDLYNTYSDRETIETILKIIDVPYIDQCKGIIYINTYIDDIYNIVGTKVRIVIDNNQDVIELAISSDGFVWMAIEDVSGGHSIIKTVYVSLVEIDFSKLDDIIRYYGGKQ